MTPPRELYSLPFGPPEPAGSGAFAQVFCAKKNGQKVAIKLARSEALSADGVTGGLFFAEGLEFASGHVASRPPDPSLVLEAEARVLLRIDHPAFPKLLASDELSIGGMKRRYIVTTWREGKTWRALLDAGQQPPLWAILRLCEALQDVQQAGTLEVHGDLKPENLLLDEEGRVTLLDPSSGMAQVTPKKSPRALVLTRWYNPALRYSDLPAIGLLLAELCTGRQLLLEATDTRPERALGSELRSWIAERERSGGAELLRRLPYLPFLEELEPSVPKGLSAICLRCLELTWTGSKLERTDRYPSLEALIAELKNVLP